MILRMGSKDILHQKRFTTKAQRKENKDHKKEKKGKKVAKESFLFFFPQNLFLCFLCALC
jgi:hypothetical protein